MTATDDTFCVYCQVEFTTRRRFINHLKRLHRDTYAFFAYVPECEQAS